MTIKEARKILGRFGDNMTDQEILVEIESATVLKDIFFKIYLEGRKKGQTNDLSIKAVQ